MSSGSSVGSGLEGGEGGRRYTIYLIIVALAGWSLASYDLNLLVLTIPDIADELNLSQGLVGSIGFFVFGAQFVVTLFVGYGMDTLGRKRMWMLCLAAAAIFTGMTFLVDSFWQLVLIRMLASGFAQAELAVSITLVNEQVPRPIPRATLLHSPRAAGRSASLWPPGYTCCLSALGGALYSCSASYP